MPHQIHCQGCHQKRKPGGAMMCLNAHKICRECSKHAGLVGTVLRQFGITRRKTCPVCPRQLRIRVS